MEQVHDSVVGAGLIHAVLQIIRSENRLDTGDFRLVDPRDGHHFRCADLTELCGICNACFNGERALQGSVGTAPEKPLSLLADVVMLVSALAHSIIDRAREISCCIQDRSVHIKNHCFILHIYPFRDVDDLS